VFSLLAREVRLVRCSCVRRCVSFFEGFFEFGLGGGLFCVLVLSGEVEWVMSGTEGGDNKI
jgi:hypothetical protein